METCNETESNVQKQQVRKIGRSEDRRKPSGDELITCYFGFKFQIPLGISGNVHCQPYQIFLISSRSHSVYASISVHPRVQSMSVLAGILEFSCSEHSD